MNKVSANAIGSILTKVKAKAEKLPYRIVIYGREGVGKTSFPAEMTKPLYLMSRNETGLETLISSGQLGETSHLPAFDTWSEFMGALDELVAAEHDFKTVVIDCLNGFEELCLEHVLQTQFNGDHASFMAYHRGYAACANVFKELTIKLDRLRIEKGMTIVCLAHSRLAKERNPLGEDYQSYKIDLHKDNSDVIRQWADAVLFFNFFTTVDSSGKAKGGKKRVAYCEPEAGFEAKNRMGLPASFDLGSSSSEGFRNFVKLFSKEA